MMVAILVLGVILTALAMTLVTSLKRLQGQERQIQANALANEFLENMQAYQWEDVGLCQTEAVSEYGAATFEGEELVLIPDTAPVCSQADRLQPLLTGVSRDGIEYSVRTAVTWRDDTSDGTAAADPDTTEDAKRLTVDLAWTDDGDARSLRMQSFRAPNANEQEFTTEISPNIIYIKDELEAVDPDATGTNWTAFDVRLFAGGPQTTVKVDWPERDGTMHGPVFLTTDDGGYSWRYSIPENVGPFRNGETLFTFTADDGSNVTTHVNRALFLHDIEARELTVPLVVNVVDATNTVCPFHVSADLQGVLQSDSVTITWDQGPAEVAMLGATSTAWGSTFTYQFDGQVGFAEDDLAAVMSVNVTRIADQQTRSFSQPVEIAEVDGC